MSNHAHLRPHNWRRGRGDHGAIPDAYATRRPAWRRPMLSGGPNVRQLAKLAERAELAKRAVRLEARPR